MDGHAQVTGAELDNVLKGWGGEAALALGAQGVWTGSVWLTTEEAETHPVVKEKFLKASSSDTIRSRSLTGKPARMLRSAWTEAWEDPENPEPRKNRRSRPQPRKTRVVVVVVVCSNSSR